jgi:predicted metal-dependent hydrolase
MTSRRQFFATIIAILLTRPLIALGWKKAPVRALWKTDPRLMVSPQMMTYVTEAGKGLFSNSAEVHRQYYAGQLIHTPFSF